MDNRYLSSQAVASPAFTLAGENEQPEERPIPGALDQAGRYLNELHMALDVLEKRIAPVSRNVPVATGVQGSGGQNAPTPVVSPVRAAILDRNAGISAAVTRVHDLIQRLDI